jgi:hypothetical protein
MSVNPWAEADAQVLGAFADGQPRHAGELSGDLPSFRVLRMILAQNVRAGHLEPHRGAVHTTYLITEAGKRHLADAMKVA